MRYRHRSFYRFSLQHRCALRLCSLIALLFSTNCDETTRYRHVTESTGTHQRVIWQHAPAQPVPTPEEIAHTAIIGDSLSFGRISFLLPMSRFILVMDQLTSPHVAVVNQRGNVLWRIGSHGDGPNKMIDPQWAYRDFSHDLQAVIYDYRNQRLFQMSLEPSGKPHLRERLRFGSAHKLRNPVLLGESVISNGYFADHTLLKLSASGAVVHSVAVAPPSTEVADRVSAWDAMYQLNRNRAAAGDSGLLVLTYQSVNRFDLFHNATYRYSWRGPVDVVMRYSLPAHAGQLRWSQDNQFAYVGVAASSKHIYWS